MPLKSINPTLFHERVIRDSIVMIRRGITRKSNRKGK